jgi:hypothetical protein
VVGATRVNVHNSIPELVEENTLQRLSKIVSNHFLGRAMFDTDLPAVNAILDEEIAWRVILAVAESLVMLVNEFVLSTQIVVQNSSAN